MADDHAVEMLRLLRVWCTILSVGLLAAIAIAIYGFSQATAATDATKHAAGQIAAAAARVATTAQLAATTAQRVAADEQATCQIQARGLPAGHQLAASMHDIHRLLTARPTTRMQRQQVRAIPLPIKRIYRTLAWHLAAYQRDEAQQPHTRGCHVMPAASLHPPVPIP